MVRLGIMALLLQKLLLEDMLLFIGRPKDISNQNPNGIIVVVKKLEQHQKHPEHLKVNE